jgi:hypothetical protein
LTGATKEALMNVNLSCVGLLLCAILAGSSMASDRVEKKQPAGGSPDGPAKAVDPLSRKIEIVELAYREVVLYGITEVQIVGRAITEAEALARTQGRGDLASSLAKQGKALNESKSGTALPGCFDEGLPCNSARFTNAAGALRKERAGADDKKKAAIDELTKLLDTAALHSALALEADAQASNLARLYCNLIADKPRYDEEEIRTAGRLARAVQAKHDAALDRVLPWTTTLYAKWTPEKAKALAGTGDIDVEACTAWWSELKSCLPKAQWEELSKNADRRTLLWMAARRKLLAGNGNFHGEETLDAMALKKIVEARKREKEENDAALGKHLKAFSVKCGTS